MTKDKLIRLKALFEVNEALSLARLDEMKLSIEDGREFERAIRQIDTSRGVSTERSIAYMVRVLDVVARGLTALRQQESTAIDEVANVKARNMHLSKAAAQAARVAHQCDEARELELLIDDILRRSRSSST